MLTTNEQSELDILLTVEEPNEWMKNRIKELRTKQASNEPLNQDEEECTCLACQVSKATTIEEHERTIYKFMLEGEMNIYSYVKNNSNLLEEQVDEMLSMLKFDKLLTISWVKWAYEEFCENLEVDSEAYKLFSNDSKSKPSIARLQMMYFCEGVLRETFSIIGMCESLISFRAFFDSLVIKNIALTVAKLSELTDIPPTDRNLIACVMVNAFSYVQGTCDEIKKLIKNLLKPIVGVL